MGYRESRELEKDIERVIAVHPEAVFIVKLERAGNKLVPREFLNQTFGLDRNKLIPRLTKNTYSEDIKLKGFITLLHTFCHLIVLKCKGPKCNVIDKKLQFMAESSDIFDLLI